MKKLLLAAAGLLLVALLLRTGPGSAPVEVRRLAMGTLVAVRLYEEQATATPLIDAAFAEIGRIDSLMSRYIDESEANQLERLAVDRAVICSPEMARVLQQSQRFAQSTAGAFDITIGPLTRLWNFPDATAPPAAERIDSALALVGYQAVVVEGRQVRVTRPGVRLDLGGAAKGYAVDQAVERLRERGTEQGLIEAGGDIRFWGEKPDGRPWRFGIQHPRDPTRYIQVEDIGLAAIATSGDYEQYFELAGRRYHHILDPTTGYPAEGAISATAWAKTALEADILSTAVFILGPERGVAWVETLPEAEVLVYFSEGDSLRHRVSSGLEGRLHFSDANN